MHSKSLLAVSGLLSLAAAIPGLHGQHEHHHHHHAEKRDLVWITETDVAVVTVPVTETVWLEPGETPPVAYSSPEAPPAASTPVSVAAHSPESSYVPPPASSSSPSSTSVAPAPTSTSQYVPPPAPTTTTTPAYVAPPAPSSTYVAPAAPSPSSSSSSPPAAAPSSSSSSGGSNSGTSNSNSGGGSGLSSGLAAAGAAYSGDITYYDTGLGACGISSGSSDAIVAISHVIFDSYPAANPNLNPVCGRKVSITGADGSTYTATVVDRCVGCQEGDLDLSQGFFNKVTGNGDGRVHGMKWTFQ